MPEKSAKIAVRSARKCEKLLDRKHAGNKTPMRAINRRFTVSIEEAAKNGKF